jgi:malonyl-CoA decarboxylase
MPMLQDMRSAARRVSANRRLRALLVLCRRLLSERGEVNSGAIARELLAAYEALDDTLRSAFFAHLAEDFNPEPLALLACAQAYAQAPGAGTLAPLLAAAEPPRQELLRRLNRLPGGTARIVAMRRALLARLHEQPELAAAEDDFLHLLGSWFNPGFLQLRRVDWRSPAQLLEQLIRHEAVHAIDGWDDLRRRLQPDRRCFAFFHPQLPDEPLIFVEVALLPDMPAAIAPLIAKADKPAPPETFKVAAFYSISNCQPGLKGVSLGNFLIKRVASELRHELPQLKTFCTLSPIPGFARWLKAGGEVPGLGRTRAQRLAQARESLPAAGITDLGALGTASALRQLPEAGHAALQRLAAIYLAWASPTPAGDPVARFHLGNGARLERLDPLADLSPKGVRQSFGLMVNYLYDLNRIDRHHEKFFDGEVAHARQIAAQL